MRPRASLIGATEISTKRAYRASTLCKFSGELNRRKFGVPMGGHMALPLALAVLRCGMIEYDMEHLGGLVGFVVRYNVMNDVFGILCAVRNDAEEELVSEGL